MASEMARHQPRIGVGAAARIEARDQVDGLAAVEIGRVLRGGRGRRHQERRNGGQHGRVW